MRERYSDIGHFPGLA